MMLMKVRNTSVLVTSTAMACLVFLLAACGNGGDASTDSTPSPVTSTASFIPASTLAPLATYTSTFTTVITDLEGNALASDFIWGVTTADVMWSTPALIDMEDVGSAYNPQIAFDASGNAIAVWVQRGRTPHSISTNMASSVWANRYVAGTGWGTAELVEVETGSLSGLKSRY
jgi:hypothetical protein